MKKLLILSAALFLGGCQYYVQTVPTYPIAAPVYVPPPVVYTPPVVYPAPVYRPYYYRPYWRCYYC